LSINIEVFLVESLKTGVDEPRKSGRFDLLDNLRS
jgi:hypothetical protein